MFMIMVNAPFRHSSKCVLGNPLLKLILLAVFHAFLIISV